MTEVRIDVAKGLQRCNVGCHLFVWGGGKSRGGEEEERVTFQQQFMTGLDYETNTIIYH